MINQLISTAKTAGDRILTLYHHPSVEISKKTDGSLLTEADTASHDMICQSLEQLFPSIPILSEESSEHQNYDSRKTWDQFFLVDPLDGTKEFINRNDEFTVNIALIKKNYPIMGVIHAPALGLTYYAEKNKGAYKIVDNTYTPLRAQHQDTNTSRILISRSHVCAKTEAVIAQYVKQHKHVVTMSMGSALKFGLIASGEADVYLRCSPTMEWDTAAGQIIVDEVGKKVQILDSNQPLLYNKCELINPGFIVA